MTAIASLDGFEPRPAARPAAPLPLVDAGRPARPALRAFQQASPAAALGLAVSYLMTKPAFAGLRFGSWSRVLVGQINRGHCSFVLDDKDRIVGFLGWVLTDEPAAEAWLAGRPGAGAPVDDGDCVVFNAWAAETAPVNRFVLGIARQAALGRRLIYFRRAYANGAVRPARLSVNAFVVRHAAAQAPRSAASGSALAPAPSA